MRRRKGTSPEERNKRLSDMAVKAFENHQIRKRSDGRWLLQRPHKDGGWDWTYAAEIICLEEPAIFVGGDIGPMVFAYGPKDPQERIRWIGEHDDLGHYIHQKAAIGSRSRLSSCWDVDVAVHEIDQLLEERVAELDEDVDPEVDDICESIERAKQVVHDGYDAVVSFLYENVGSWMEDPPQLGMVTDPGVFYAWAALARLCTLLDQEKEKEGHPMADQQTQRDNVVPVPEPEHTPISEIPERKQLGTLIQRYRTNEGFTLKALADAVEIDQVVLERVESFDAPLDAQSLKNIAACLKVRWEPLLDAAKAFHRAVWREEGNTGGVQLSDQEAQVKSLKQPLPPDAEQALIKSADELLFTHNVLKEASERALNAAVEVRQVLAEHGVIEADAPMEMLDDPKVNCADCGTELDRNKMDLIGFISDETGEKVYFCDRSCADSWAEKGQGRG